LEYDSDAQRSRADLAFNPQLQHRKTRMSVTLLLTHGAGANADAPLLVAVDEALSAAGVRVIRYTLPFRRERPHGPPRHGDPERDRAGLRERIEALGPGPVFVGGHSYGGRQATMLVSEQPDLVAGLLLLSYPLHPPRQKDNLRTAHFPALRTPALFLHGSRDPFGSPEEMAAAVALIPGRTKLVIVDRAGHDLRVAGIGARIAADFAWLTS
jgi:predicted alpha/beta-hydrolase family hydrolase